MTLVALHDMIDKNDQRPTSYLVAALPTFWVSLIVHHRNELRKGDMQNFLIFEQISGWLKNNFLP